MSESVSVMSSRRPWMPGDSEDRHQHCEHKAWHTQWQTQGRTMVGLRTQTEHRRWHTYMLVSPSSILLARSLASSLSLSVCLFLSLSLSPFLSLFFSLSLSFTLAFPLVLLLCLSICTTLSSQHCQFLQNLTTYIISPLTWLW